MNKSVQNNYCSIVTKEIFMRRKITFAYALLLLTVATVSGQQTAPTEVPKRLITQDEKTLNSQWRGKRVAFLGDSMTDKRRIGTTFAYWEYLSELMGIEPYVYGISGNQWDDIYKQAKKLHDEHGSEVDAILIFAGANDFSHDTPTGLFFSETIKDVNHNGEQVSRKYRTQVFNDTSFCGRINKVFSYLKTNYPQQQIIILTPIHRGFAKFSDKNIQPDESYANKYGLYIGDYVNTLKQAASIWAVSLIDLFSLSGLYPLAYSQSQYFHNTETDRLHPNAAGDYRLAKTIQYQLMSLPSTFVEM